MAKGELTIGGDVAAAVQSFVNAVTYMGGSVTSMNPARPVEFSVRKAGSMFSGMGAPYSGTATFVPMGNAQTRVLIEIKPRLWYSAVAVGAAIVVLSIIGYVAEGAGEDETLVMSMAAVFALATAVTLYLYYVPWPQTVIERIELGVHGALPGGGVAPVAAPPQPAPAAPSGGETATVADQLEQLRALHEKGLISDAEHERKREDILKRL